MVSRPEMADINSAREMAYLLPRDSAETTRYVEAQAELNYTTKLSIVTLVTTGNIRASRIAGDVAACHDPRVPAMPCALDASA